MKRYTDIYNLNCGDEGSTLTFDVRERYGKYNYIIKRNKNGKLYLSISQKLATRLKLENEIFITEWIDEDILVISAHPMMDNSVKIPLKTDKCDIRCRPEVACLSDVALNFDFTNKISKVYHDVIFNNNGDDSMAVLTFYRVTLGDITAPPVGVEEVILKNRSPRNISVGKQIKIF